MKNLLIVLAIFCVLNANAQNYLISFAGTGESTTVNTVEVENLTAGTSLTLNGDDILRLNTTTGVNSIENGQSSRIKIYPNPMPEKSKLLISAPDEGNAIISVSDITGKFIAHIRSDFEFYPQEFTLSGLKSGLYIVNVKGNTYQFSGKLLSNGKSTGPTVIEKVGDKKDVNKQVSVMDTKGVQADADMDYTMGDIIKFTGISGIYSTVVTSILDADKTITFNFIACTDGDNNNYPVVELGTQIWMEENLKTTKYNNTNDIPFKPVANEWKALISPGYCWYDNDATANKDIYGALYNWYTATNTEICPSGWHVPTHNEWTTLINYLGNNIVAGGKLKETGTTHWNSPNTDATNESGFTGLPSGWRNQDGTFLYIRMNEAWWSTTEYNTDYAYERSLNYESGQAFSVGFNPKRNGYSIRCIKD
ncbi:MAG: T9SS type A sorting domain-containing protein [Bacteroidales bacterium]|nr:T9SS type A sorting domain-containing protein [Bacteroidales bacterium]